MVKKQYVIPGLLMGIAMLGGSTALAFGGGELLSSGAFSTFSAEKQAAIQKAHEIRLAAEEEAQDVLLAAGVTQEEMHKAMRSFHEKERAAMDEALTNNDFDAFKELVAGTPMEDHLTEDTFKKIVEIHSLEENGDREEAWEIRRELKEDAGMMFMGRGMGHHVIHEAEKN
jgi:hypothetical protein